MDHWFSRLPESSANESGLENEINLSTLQESRDYPDRHKDASLVAHAPTLDSQHDHYSDPKLKYISQMLLEDSNIDENNNTSLYIDPISLRAAEHFFYDALHQNPSSPNQEPPFVNNKSGCRDSTFRSSSSCNTGLSKSYVERSNGSSFRLNSIMNTQMDSFNTVKLGPNVYSDTESALQCKRGMEEASRFLPPEYQLLLSTDKGHSADTSRGKKHQHSGDVGLQEERRTRQSAISEEEEVELAEVFDKVLLFSNNKDHPSVCGKGTQQKGRCRGKGYAKKLGETCENVDLPSLLISCAQSIADVEHMIAKEKLMKIRMYSSPTGDANQRLGHAFANALEARLAGTGPQLYALSSTISASKIITAYRTCFKSWPFMSTSFSLANTMIYEVASESNLLHIIDFGIIYSFQWPILIQKLSQRPGGPPKLRITAIELPQPGFRPEEMVQTTGCLLTKCCERFGVSFEYNAITTQNWETLKLEDLKLVTSEIVAISCAYRFENLLDDTVVAADTQVFPKDAVLNLIREMNPKVYVHTLLSGSHNSAFFINRFREALFFYITLFDMCDCTIPRDDPDRLGFEEARGCDIMSIVACEGRERLYRPETYKQWHLRYLRAGLKPMPIRPELAKELRDKAEAGFPKKFLFLEDDHWILQGWKGRVFSASSCWTSA